MLWLQAVSPRRSHSMDGPVKPDHDIKEMSPLTGAPP